MTNTNLRSQFLVSDVSCVHDTLEHIHEDMGIISIVISPFKFFYVAIHVFDAHLVKCTSNRTLKQAPYAFNTVCVNITDNPFFFRMIDGFVACNMVCDADVRLQFIRVDSFGLILNGSFDKVMQGLFPNVRDSFNTNRSATLDSSNNPRLVALVSMTLALYLATYKRLINFNYADKSWTFKRLIPHRLTDAMAEIPGRLVRNPKSAFHLISRDSLLGFTHEIDSYKPSTQGQMGIMHDSSAHYGELIPATFTFPAIVLWKLKHFKATATGTVNPARPADTFKYLTALIIGLKFIHQRYEVYHGSRSP